MIRWLSRGWPVFLLLCVAGVAPYPTLPVWAATNDLKATPATSQVRKPTNTVPKIRFRPLSPGAPSVRLTGGSRGTGDALVKLDVLVPDEVGLTTQGQPSLFWYQSKPAKAKFELTLLQEDEVKPLA